jgi:hypothetical protein
MTPRTKIPVESIRRQTDDERDCAFFAIQNLYVWAVLEPPTLEDMRSAAHACYTTAPDHMGLTVTDQMMLLQQLRCPLLLAVAIVPNDADVRRYFPTVLDAGCALLVGYFYTYGGTAYGHSVVAESWSDEGLSVLCSGSPAQEGKVVEWDAQPSAPAPLDARPHGCRNIVPWRTIADADKIVAGLAPARGINRTFIIAWLPSDEARGLL